MRAVILSGGSEIVSVALADEFTDTGIPIAVLALGNSSILKETLPNTPYNHIEWPPTSPHRAIGQIESILRHWGATPENPWPIFPTEDGGLRLLLEHRHLLGNLGVFSRAHKLQLGGLDKAELFEYLQNNSCGDVIAPTRAVSKLDQIPQAIECLGGDCVIKPSLKPLSMQLKGMKAKTFLTNSYSHIEVLLAQLSISWPSSDKWIVQTRLTPSPKGEPAYWAIRDRDGNTSGIGVVQHWKQPKSGGTGCWVITTNELSDIIQPQVKRILDTIDFQGMCELEFLQDSKGNWRLLELNPRPWLQVGLAHKAGVILASKTVPVLQGDRLNTITATHMTSWVNAERLFLAALSGDYGPRLSALNSAFRALRHANDVAIYSSLLPGIRTRWMKKVSGKALRFLSR